MGQRCNNMPNKSGTPIIIAKQFYVMSFKAIAIFTILTNILGKYFLPSELCGTHAHIYRPKVGLNSVNPKQVPPS